jgi:hypothetical protein
MARVDENGVEWLDLTDPVEAAKFDAQAAAMEPLTYADVVKRREARQAKAAAKPNGTAVQ